jgi:hypothetical protein
MKFRWNYMDSGCMISQMPIMDEVDLPDNGQGEHVT